jgi:hypothetical protein
MSLLAEMAFSTNSNHLTANTVDDGAWLSDSQPHTAEEEEEEEGRSRQAIPLALARCIEDLGIGTVPVGRVETEVGAL